jgi:hypothetical protein
MKRRLFLVLIATLIACTRIATAGTVYAGVDLIIRASNGHPRAAASVWYKTFLGMDGHELAGIQSYISNTGASWSGGVYTPYNWSLEGSSPAAPPNCYQGFVSVTTDDSNADVTSNQICMQGPPPPNDGGGGGSSDRDPFGSGGYGNEDIPCFPGDAGCPYSPIVMNFDTGDYKLTGSNAPVSFDMRGDGHPPLIGWTAEGRDEAFLWLDRNHNGRVTSGAELFGNFTPLKSGALAKNGFEALAEFDANHDGIIDDHDPVWSQLQLWRDLNHNGISDDGESTPLAGSQVTSMELRYHWTGRHDNWGNTFRYEALISVVNPSGHGTSKKPAYDIFFVSVSR